MTGDQYWSEIADSGDDHIAYPLWRDYCDTLHARLLRSWLHGAKFSTALKTDLFDEACGNGMASELERISRKRRIQSGNVNPVRKAGWRSANALLKRLFPSSLMSQRG